MMNNYRSVKLRAQGSMAEIVEWNNGYVTAYYYDNNVLEEDAVSECYSDIKMLVSIERITLIDKDGKRIARFWK